jgi:TOMM system kinase/cyclase fusion protein
MEPEAARPAKGFLFEDRYEILEELGSGSFGRVYWARQLSAGQSVAIKLLSPREGTESSTGREAERFRRETRICAELSHPHIVRLIDAGETREGQLYAVFENVPGETLEQALEGEGRLAVREALRLMTQVLEALECAHANGIVHRDLKPSNLMLSGTAPRRNAVVLDFGLGGLVQGRRRKDWQTLTQTGVFEGTPLYAAPEQLDGETPTERSDLYAWGLVFLECLTGRPPFAEAGAMERLLSGGGSVEIPEWLRGHRLGQLLETVTAREAAKRDVPIESLIEALDAIAVGELPLAPEDSTAPRPLAESGERRHLTVMFCDLVGSSALGQRLGSEGYRRLVQAYHARAAEAIERWEGHVAQHLGDGLLVYFGYPHAHEDDAERAVRSGREILRELATLNPRLEAEYGIRLQARVGIHTGPVEVGGVGSGKRRETLAIGDTVNVAARLEAFAEPDTVVISDATLRLVAGLFVTEDRGTPELKGIEQPVGVHRVIQPSGVSGRLERAPRLTPFVGREQELGLLLDRFEQAQEGRGQAVLIGGEAGIGKSRLMHQLREQLRDATHSWLECRCSPYTQSSPLYPLIGMLEDALDLREEDSDDAKLGRLERGLAHVELEPAEAVPLLASLLSLRLPERYPPLEISPRLQRQRTLETLLAWLLALADKQPVVLLVEDLHWIDPSTLEWLGLLIEQCPTAGLLLLLTHRPDFEPPWPSRTHLLPMGLIRLSRRQAKQLIAGRIRHAALPEALLDAVAERSDCVPLFAEELAKSIEDPDPKRFGSLSELQIPETLQDSLMARLDRLGEAKQVAQVGAAIGREFSYALLGAVAPVKETALREGLGSLVQAELVYQRGLPPKATYTFKHALVQDTAYASLLDSQRRELHARIADALARHFPERVDREPERLAHHCARAGRVDDAVAHYQRAAQRAAQRFAQSEAIAHLDQAIELLGALDAAPARREREIQLQIALGSAHFSVKGGWDPGAERAYARARELCGEASESPALVRALIGLSLFHFERGQVRVSCGLAERALALAERAGEVYPRMVAHTRLGITLLYLDPRRCHEHLERAVALYDPSAHRPLAAAWGQDWGATGRGFAAAARLARGHLDCARRLMDETVALAREGDPYSLSFALAMAAATHRLLRERTRTLETAEEAIAIAREHGFPIVLIITGAYRGWAMGGSRGIEQIETAIQRGSAARLPTIADWYVGLSEACLEQGRTEAALAAVQAGLGVSDEVHLSDPPLHHVRGQILLQRGALEDAERSFRTALQQARQHELGLREIEAATSLARLLRDRGRRDEARALLQPVYEGFTEGFDTAALKDARALLGELEPTR